MKTCLYCSKKLKRNKTKWCSHYCETEGGKILRMIKIAKCKPKRTISPEDAAKFKKIQTFLGRKL